MALGAHEGAVTRGRVHASGGLERSPGGPTPTTRNEFVWGVLWPSRGVSMSPSDLLLTGQDKPPTKLATLNSPIASSW